METDKEIKELAIKPLIFLASEPVRWVVPVPRFGAGELRASPVGKRTLLAFIVKAGRKEGKAGEFFWFRQECGSETKPAVTFGEMNSEFPISNGQTLADVVKVDVQPGLYKIGSPVRLGTVRLEGVDDPLMLHVYWKDGDKK
jgi:hypothetical protein